MKNQWLARKPIVVDWDEIGLTETYSEKLEALYVIMINKKNSVGGRLVWMSREIYQMFKNHKPYAINNNQSWLSCAAYGLGGLEHTIRIVYSSADGMIRPYVDIKVVNFPAEDACDS